jgi:hypothetical protein
MIERAAKFLAGTSPLAKRAATAHQHELAQFERESAMASTAKAMSAPSRDALEASAAAAELAERLTITTQRQKFRLELWGDRAGNAIGVVGRHERYLFNAMPGSPLVAGNGGAGASRATTCK